MKHNISFTKLVLFTFLVLGSSFFSNQVLGLECLNQDPCPKQVRKIVKYARNGSPDAQLMLAAMYEDGHILNKSPKKAFKWYRKATKQTRKISVAYFKTGVDYIYGKGTSKNIEKGMEQLTVAAKHHHIPSQLLLGSIYFDGDLVKQNFKKARYWFKESAKSHDARAAFAFAQMNELGLGGSKDLDQARKWYLISGARGYQKALDKAARLKVTDAEIKRVKAKIEIADKNNANKGNILTVYGNQMNEMQMMDLVLDNINESGFYSNIRTGSHIPGHNCLDDRRNCQYIKDPIAIQRILGVGRP